MKKEILNQFKNSMISRDLANSIVGGYFQTGTMGGGGTTCNNVWCPSTGGSCTYLGPCQSNGQTRAHYSCTQPGASQAYKDSLVNANPGQSFIVQGPYSVTCTGYGPV